MLVAYLRAGYNIRALYLMVKPARGRFVHGDAPLVEREETPLLVWRCCDTQRGEEEISILFTNTGYDLITPNEERQQKQANQISKLNFRAENPENFTKVYLLGVGCSWTTNELMSLVNPPETCPT